MSLRSLHSVSLSVKIKVLNQKTPKKLSIYPEVGVEVGENTLGSVKGFFGPVHLFI